MKAMKTNLHLNLNFSRKDSSSASQSVPTPNSSVTGFMTPVDQGQSFLFQTPAVGVKRSDSVSSQYPELSKVNSFSSMTSSFDTADNSPVNLQNYEFSPVFDDVLIGLYHSYANRPNITPFNINFPPSGIVSKISKQMYQRLISDRTLQLDKSQKTTDDLLTDSNQEICLSIIRRRLLDLCSAAAAESETLTRCSSVSSTSGPLIPQPRPSWLHQNPTFSATRLSSTDSLVDSVQITPQQVPPLQMPYRDSQTDISMITPPQSRAGYSPASTKPKLSIDHFSFENTAKLQSPFTETQFHFGPSTQSPSNPVFPKRPQKSNSLSSLFSGPGTPTGAAMPELEVDPLYNVTAQRKRDSLKLKRNMK
ncbi:hypothetical protein KL921_000806 [Ogataea angusta]|uniref:Uncharacterized protein n=1 Tax=Pichia angusta TaxID=870730 RepID=A0AAN6I898_PICAN|nr:uncharacterized protein KL928_000974 [Ogataea angusta]KAG7813260.1 hypothetical protein KL921_000806 [Ogataea angusta]KAG7820890.1 hypothetical protein KL928_000974 [Ogataea angusta]KAG7831844.1 hypothetical protein KL920_000179 [Ogataea angusta]KAG7836016.1 hypothetical protein KL943_001665 [Ogataea angusta]KAG7843082.1 hypothetical protein KL942_000178 [Ogataea angusta]